ncbi:MAG: diguanylate cyclase [Proteobacteria bacterium]|nr:diguanylate cyclase [Pseudomonadota bacterium]
MVNENKTPDLEEFFSVINDPERLTALKQLNIVYSPAEERFDRVTRMARSYFDMPMALISIVTMGNMLWYKSRQGVTCDGEPESAMMSMCGRCIMRDEILLIEDTHQDPMFKDNIEVKQEPFVRFYVGIPLRTGDGLKVGTLCLLDTKPRKFNQDKQDMLRDMAYWVENEIKMSLLMESHRELTNRFDELQRKALIDPLTQVWNRNGMDEVVKHELSRAERKRCNVTVMLIDVDNLKEINDNYGHHAGDIMLQEVAQRIRMCLRPHDILIRYGGDEFLVVLTDCSQQVATDIAERTRLRANDKSIDIPEGSINTSLSIGIVSKDNIKSDMINSLIKNADQALYKAKENGRNCIEIYTI